MPKKSWKSRVQQHTSTLSWSGPLSQHFVSDGGHGKHPNGPAKPSIPPWCSSLSFCVNPFQIQHSGGGGQLQVQLASCLPPPERQLLPKEYLSNSKSSCSITVRGILANDWFGESFVAIYDIRYFCITMVLKVPFHAKLKWAVRRICR